MSGLKLVAIAFIVLTTIGACRKDTDPEKIKTNPKYQQQLLSTNSSSLQIEPSKDFESKVLATLTPTIMPTSTPVPITPTPTTMPTFTPVPPTLTPTTMPTSTPVPPTLTPTNIPTSTPVPITPTPTTMPTSTPVPPTLTPTAMPTPTPGANQYILKAKELFKNGDFIKAIDYYSEAIRLDPGQEILYHLRGLAYVKVGRHELGIKDFDKALEIDPKQVAFYSDRGKAYIELGNYWKAILDYSQAIEISPRTAERYYDRGLANQRSGYYAKAIDDYSNTIRLDTKHEKAYLGRGEAYLITGKLVQSIKDFSKAIAFNQNWAVAYFNRGLSYQRLGNSNLALQDYKTANRIEPDNQKFKKSMVEIESSISNPTTTSPNKSKNIVQDQSTKNGPSKLFVPITHERSRELLLAIENLPGLGGSVITPDGVNTISTLEEMFSIFNTAYYLLTGDQSIWKPRIFTRTQYQKHVRDIGIPALVDYPAYCCEKTPDGLTFIIDGSYSAYKVLGFIAHEAGHARQRTLNPNQGLDNLTLNKRAFYEAEAFAFEAAIIRLIGEYSGINATILPLDNKYDLEPWVGNWTNSTSIKTDDPYQLHLRGLAIIWGAIIMDPELLDLKSELIQNHILSPESMLKLYNHLIYKKSNEIDDYVDLAIYHFKVNKGQIKKTILSRGGAIHSEGFFEQLYSLFLFP